ncbi:MAG: HAD-IA family hydrolase [Chitinivibrionales bacterium]|nr:HAD-IA family hydrolase [Chitinivibrionales bacterium]MBD3357830.1 HAD-IA family hydrolase [Chitinivibrionales bacterium]
MGTVYCRTYKNTEVRTMEMGVLFDWDGVIVDSSSQHERSWELLAQEEGRNLPEGHFRKGFGMKNEAIIPDVLGWTEDREEIRRLSLRKEALYRELLAADRIQPLPGVAEFVRLLDENGVAYAVGSSTHRENIEAALEVFEARPSFPVIVTGEDVQRGKPDPQVYLLAAERIGRHPSECVVFEDVPAGIRAAHNGGMKAVAVCTTHPARHLAEAEMVIDNFQTLPVERLRHLLNGE